MSICQQTNALQADMIVLLGDYIAGHPYQTRAVPPEAWASAFASLRAPLGVHAILGNHDWWEDRDAQRRRKGPIFSRRVLEQAGIPVYENDVVRLTKDGRPFWLAGLGDQIAFVNRKPPERATLHRRRRSRGHAGQGHRRRTRRALGA